MFAVFRFLLMFLKLMICSGRYLKQTKFSLQQWIVRRPFLKLESRLS